MFGMNEVPIVEVLEEVMKVVQHQISGQNEDRVVVDELLKLFNSNDVGTIIPAVQDLLYSREQS